MKKSKQKINAKINLTLEIVGAENGFHNIESLTASVNIADVVTVTKRPNGIITLREKGIQTGVPVTENNAYKAAELFRSEYNVGGADVVINKKIPLASGLGGSSADIAGVLKGMAAVYGVKEPLNGIADRLGSDVSYMLNGGYAVISGRGGNVKKINSKRKLFILIVTHDSRVTAKTAYEEYDKLNLPFSKGENADIAALKLCRGERIDDCFKNDLYQGVKRLVPQLESTLSALQKAGGSGVMTGSGTAVTGIFFNRNKRDGAYKKLKKQFGKRLIKAETVAKV